MLRLRPYVILNSAMSLDGKIATRKGEFRLSSDEDRKRVHTLRGKTDGVMVGLRTVLIDDPKLTVKYSRGRNPTRIIVDTYGRTPVNSYIVKTASKIPTIIGVSGKARLRNIRKLEHAGVIVLVCGKQDLVSLPTLMRQLRKRGIRTVLLEGGGTLNWNMLSQGLVDEISVAVSPQIVGGEDAVTLADGKGAAGRKDSVKLKFLKSNRYGADLVLHYKVLGR